MITDMSLLLRRIDEVAVPAPTATGDAAKQTKLFNSLETRLDGKDNEVT